MLKSVISQECVRSLRTSLGSYKSMRHCDESMNNLTLNCIDLPMTTAFNERH